MGKLADSTATENREEGSGRKFPGRWEEGGRGAGDRDISVVRARKKERRQIEEQRERASHLVGKEEDRGGA